MWHLNLVHSRRLHSGADGSERIHLGKADSLAVDVLGLLDHNRGAGLALRPGRSRGIGWFWLCVKPGLELVGIRVKS